MQRVKVILQYHIFFHTAHLYTVLQGQGKYVVFSGARETEKQCVSFKNGHSQANHNPSMPLPSAPSNPDFFFSVLAVHER